MDPYMRSTSRSHTKNALVAVACIGLLAVTSAAQAKLITFNFSGVLDGGPGAPFDGQMAYSGTYSFESVQPNVSTTPDEGDYLLTSATLDVGSTHYESSTGSITVLKDRRLHEDAYLVGALIGTDDTAGFQIPLIYDSFDVFADLSLPLMPPPVTGRDTLFPVGITLFGLLGFDGQLTGTLDSITCVSCDNSTPVSTPPTWSLMSLATASLFVFCGPLRRRRSHTTSRMVSYSRIMSLE
jgi:hypothetical protein